MKWKPITPTDAVILIVEDNLNNFILMTRLLAYLGIKKCEWKASGWQVLEFAENLGKVDLILMDIALPESDGYEALASLRLHPRFQKVPIVAVTADVSVENQGLGAWGAAEIPAARAVLVPGEQERTRRVERQRQRLDLALETAEGLASDSVRPPESDSA